jgi:hypothetical protein
MPVELGNRGHQAGLVGPEQHGGEIERTPVGAVEPSWMMRTWCAYGTGRLRLIEALARVSPTAATQHPSRVPPIAYTIRAP